MTLPIIYRCPTCNCILGGIENGEFVRKRSGFIVDGSDIRITITCHNSRPDKPHKQLLIIKGQDDIWREIIL